MEPWCHWKAAGAFRKGSGEGSLQPAQLVDDCLNQMGAIRVDADTRSTLLNFASNIGDLDSTEEETQGKIAEMIGMAAATIEFQRS